MIDPIRQLILTMEDGSVRHFKRARLHDNSDGTFTITDLDKVDEIAIAAAQPKYHAEPLG